jgi:hypothetical protein
MPHYQKSYPNLQPDGSGDAIMSGLSDQTCKRILEYCETKFEQPDDIEGLRLILDLIQENEGLAQDSGRRDGAQSRGYAQDAVARWNELEAARREIQPVVGDAVLACDSADAVYRVALKSRGESTAGLSGRALKVAWDICKGGRARSTPAQDAALAKKYGQPHMKVGGFRR